MEVALDDLKRLDDADLYDFARQAGVLLHDLPTREIILIRLTRLAQ